MLRIGISKLPTFILIALITFSTASPGLAQCQLFFERTRPRISPVNGSIYKAADMNADGHTDLVGLHEDPFNSNNRQQIFILPGDGQGSFGTPILTTTRSGWWMDDMIIGDYDNDNLKDVMVRFNQPARDHLIYRNNGNGTFTAVPNSSGPLNFTGIEFLLDVNADGKGDLVAGFGNGYRIFPGNGDGTFQTPFDVGIGFSILTGDINGDGRSDFVIANTVAMNNGNGSFTQIQNGMGSGQGENPMGVADVDGDGKHEIVTLMLNQPIFIGILKFNGTNGFTRTNYPVTPAISTQRTALFTGNFGGNSTTDIILVAPDSSRTIALINDGTGSFSTEIKTYSSAANFAGDFDEDGKSDLLVASNGRSTVGFTGKNFPEINTLLLRNSCTASGQTRYVDFNATGFSDFASWNPSDGIWSVRSSYYTNHVRLSDPWGLGILGDIPAPGDFDGDGKTDKSVYRNSTGTWWVQTSLNGGYFSFNFGLPGDRPAVGDYDGDSKSDIAVWRPSDGVWYIWLTGPQEFRAAYWGLNGDKPVPADYDGDGKTDVAVYRPSTGIWYVLKSNGTGFSAVRFGLETDRLIPADYDGDGSDDIAVFRDSGRVFHMLRSSNGAYYGRTFGFTSITPFGGDFNGDGVAEIGGYISDTSSWIMSTQGGSHALGAINSTPVGSLLVATP